MRHKKNTKKNYKNIQNFPLQLDFFSGKKFHKKKKKISKKIQKTYKKLWELSKKSIYIFLLSIIIITGYILFYSSLFSLQNIYIYRNDTISNIERAYRTVDYMRGGNIFSLDTQNTVNRLQKSQPSLKFIKIQKKIPHTLEIHLESYKALFRQEENIILENGVIFDTNTKPDESLNYLHTVRSQDADLQLNHIHLADIKKASDDLEKKLFPLQSKEIYYFETEKEFFIILENEIVLIFDLERNIQNQLEKLIIFHNEKQDLSQSDMIYIDLRISGKIFTCKREEEKNCNENLRRFYNYSPKNDI